MDDYRIKKQKEVDDNFSAINILMNEKKIPPEKYGTYALMKNKEIKGYYSTWGDAYQAGTLKYDDKLFSIQQVTTNIVDLGYYSHAFV
ncbi:MAG: hypothetical protein ACR2PY_08960 [Salinispira sp.]